MFAAGLFLLTRPGCRRFERAPHSQVEVRRQQKR
jgi:hypothetical protein